MTSEQAYRAAQENAAAANDAAVLLLVVLAFVLVMTAAWAWFEHREDRARRHRAEQRRRQLAVDRARVDDRLMWTGRVPR